MFCHRCGSKIDEGATFCPFCGTKIENDQGQWEGPPNTKAHQKPPQPPVGSAPAGSSPPSSNSNEPPSKFELWWTHAQMVEKVFFVLGIAVAVILVIVLLMNLWELLVAALVIAGVIFAFVTGSKEDRSEIRRFILKGAAVIVAITVIAIVVITNQDFFLNLIQPGMGVRTAYLTQYSEDVTVEELSINSLITPSGVHTQRTDIPTLCSQEPVSIWENGQMPASRSRSRVNSSV